MITTQNHTERDRYRLAFEQCVRERVLPTPTNMIDRGAPGYHPYHGLHTNMMLAGRLSRLRFMLLRKYGFTQSRSFAHWRQPDWDLAVLRLPEHPFTGPLN